MSSKGNVSLEGRPQPEGCVTCGLLDSKAYVQCDECDRWYHLKCIHKKLTEVEDVPWSCASCVERVRLANQSTPIKPAKASNTEVPDESPQIGDDSSVLLIEMRRLFAEQEVALERKIESLNIKVNDVQSVLLKEVATSKSDFQNELHEQLGSLRNEFTAHEDLVLQKLGEHNKDIFQLRLDVAKGRQEGSALQVKPSTSSGMSGSEKQVSFKLNETEENYQSALSISVNSPKSDISKTPTRVSNVNSSVRSSSEVSDSAVETLTKVMTQRMHYDLPEFTGLDMKSWALFEAIYNSTTEKAGFDEQQNVDRLRKALKPPASDFVLNLLSYSTDATRIMSELKERFGRPDRLMLAYQSALLALPPVTRPNDPNMLKFSLDVKTFVATAKSTKCESALGGDYILMMLESKLASSPYYVPWQKLKDDAMKKESKLNMEDFAAFLCEKVKQMPPDFSAITTVPEKVKIKDKQSTSKRVLNHFKAESNSKKSVICVKCKQHHQLFRCDEFKALALNDRWNFVRANKICFSCLATSDHLAPNCPSKRVCGLQSCKKNHNRVLHKDTSSTVMQAVSQNASQSQPVQLQSTFNANAKVFESKDRGGLVVPASQSPVASTSKLSGNVNVHSNNVSQQKKSVLFKIVPIRLHGKSKTIDSFALLDDGSSLTLMDEKLFKDLKLDGEDEELCLQWTRGITRKEVSKRASIVVSDIKNRKKFTLENFNTVTNLDLPTQSMDVSDMKKKFPQFRNLPLEQLDEVQPMMLIGLEHSHLLTGTRVVFGNEGDPVACKTPLAWVVFGKASPSMNVRSLSERKPSRILLHKPLAPEADLHDLVKSYFTTENFGVSPSSRSFVTEEDQRAELIMKSTLKLVNNRYEIGLLWKSDDVKLPNNYEMAYKRLLSEERKLLKDDSILKWKNDHVASLLSKGYARVATKDELQVSWPRIWYCPTFVITNRNKFPPKMRDVCDVAAQVNGESLNTNLLKGPDNLAPLAAGLFRFREGAVAVNADVREMFHQIRIKSEDQQCQRFLWRDCHQNQEPTVYIFEAMMFGPKCSPSCSQFVKNHHAALHRDQFPAASEALISSTYVDDYFNSHDSEEEAFTVMSNAIEICASMSFELVGVQSNSLDLLKRLPVDNIKDKLVSLDVSDFDSYVTKVLGMFWKASKDVYTFVFFESEAMLKMAHSNYCPTKREVLSTVMKVFDPLGFLSPFTVVGKIILQEIWRYGCSWDEAIPVELKLKWSQFISGFKEIGNIEIPRHYSPGMSSASSVSLIVFVDASEEAYAASAYFRFEDASGCRVALVMAKAKVAPIKQLTVPQLELQAAVLGVRLASTIKSLHSFKINSTKFFSDSKCVLLWICSKTYKFKSFVAVRVGEILDGSTQAEWYHIGTKENVADDATRSDAFSFINSESRWFKGPEFLLKPETEWPVTKSHDFSSISPRDAHLLLISSSSSISLPSFDILNSIKPKFSANWPSFVRVVAFILRFKNKLSKRNAENSKFITPSEFKVAETYLFRKVQIDSFKSEVSDLMNPEKFKVSSQSKILSLCPFMDSDGVIRMSSRAQQAKISYAARNPAILPNQHPLVDLLIQHQHEINQHMSDEAVIADLREKVWIVSVRVAVNRVKSHCQWCKIKKAKPVIPLMGQLPVARLDFGVRPFSYVGVDCFGPLLVKQGRSEVKRYGIIFTCLTYRAVYLELLSDMSLSQVLIAIRSLFVRRGKCKQLYSDNGSNFVGSNNQLAKEQANVSLLLGDAVSKKFQVQWSFIPAYSPWMGGAWERLIQSVKKSINFTVKDEKLTEDVLRGALIEAEFHINRRPLTHTPLDHEDAEPLSPNMVLFGDNNVENLAPGLFSENDKYSKYVHRRVQHLAKKFQCRWIREYLPEITRRSKWNKNQKPIEVNDLVLVVEPDNARDTWKRGLVIKVHHGPDNVVRSADVVLADKSIKTNRAVGRLAVLDVRKSIVAATQRN